MVTKICLPSYLYESSDSSDRNESSDSSDISDISDSYDSSDSCDSNNKLVGPKTCVTRTFFFHKKKNMCAKKLFSSKNCVWKKKLVSIKSFFNIFFLNNKKTSCHFKYFFTMKHFSPRFYNILIIYFVHHNCFSPKNFFWPKNIFFHKFLIQFLLSLSHKKNFFKNQNKIHQTNLISNCYITEELKI